MRLHIIAVILLSIIAIQRYEAAGQVKVNHDEDLRYEYEPLAATDEVEAPGAEEGEGEEVEDGETEGEVDVKTTTTTTTTTRPPSTTTTVSLSWDPDKVYKLDDKNYYYNYNDDSYDDSYRRKKNYRNNYNDNYGTDKYRSKRRYRSPDSMGHMNIYIRDSEKYGKKGKSKKVRFPAARYSREHYPRQFGRLMSFLPWVPIFVDRLTKQTIIHSPTGGIIIIPPVINFYGKLYSVAELIASGYASLVSTGAPPPVGIDAGPLVQPGAVVGPGIPPFDRSTGGFRGGVRTGLRAKFPTKLD